MNNKEGNNKRGGSRPNSSRPNANKPKPALPKRAQGTKKPKFSAKASEEATKKIEKNQIQSLKDQKQRMKFV